MSKEITTEQLECFGNGLRDSVGKVVSRGKLLAANTAKAIVKRRIFNEGKNAEEQAITFPSPKGKRVGSYSATHARKRQERGAATSKVNLQLTDRLFNSIQVRQGKRGAYLGIVPGKRSDGKISNQQLAAFLESNYKQIIFEASEQEAEVILDAVADDVVNEIDKLISRCL